MIRALIVDDERMARKRLRTLLAKEADVEVIGECENGSAAIDAIRGERPDVVFLDVQMPELDGFDVLRALREEERPLVVFVTAYDQYAVEAFRVNALDYLAKPFDRARFDETLRRVRRQIAMVREGSPTAEAELHQKLSALLAHVERLDRGERYSQRLMVKHGGRVTFLRVDEIDWIEAAGNYVKVHAGPSVHLLHESLVSLAERLDPAQFARVHRSTIVNLDRIREVQPWFHGDSIMILRDGTRLTVSRTYRASLDR
jgi:two-component system, LytTR family, response regulator